MDIILLFQSTTQKSWRQKLSGVHRFARERNWFVQIVNSFSSASEIRGALATWRPAGCLVDRAMSRSAPPDLLFGGIPTVYLDQNARKPSATHPNLLHDSAAEAALAGGELLRLECRSYAYLGMGKDLDWDRERQERFQKDVHAKGMSLTVLNRREMRRQLDSLPKPCGILAANDLCAAEAFNAALSAGLSVPGDVAIAGIDNDEILCEAITPGITSAEPDFEGAGYRLAAMLADEIEREKSGTPREGPPTTEFYGPLRLVRRGSTAPSRGISPRVRRALEYIRRHACDGAIGIDAVTAEMGCSRRLATMSFRRETGHSILDEIHDRRHERACDLLAQTNLPIATVVAQCGYASDAFVKRMFLKRTGLTMRDWRKRHQAPSCMRQKRLTVMGAPTVLETPARYFSTVISPSAT